jgi:uncharacterized protein YjbJ (UPF0337 family)
MSGEKDKAKGKVKQAAGDLTDDEKLRREGKVDEATGKVKDAADRLGDRVEDAADKARDKLTRDR